MSVFEVRINDRYSLKGNYYPAEQPKANLLVITGMQEYSARYAPFAAEMNRLGVSVSVMDHFGQGENAPSVDDLQKWPENAWYMTINALNIKVGQLRSEGLPVFLMGHSMGSFAVQAYLEEYPDTVDKTVIMGSNGPNRQLYSAAYTIARMTVRKGNRDKPSKLLTSLSVGGYAKGIKDRRTDLDWLSYNEENVAKYIADPYCGHRNTCGFFKEFLYGMDQLYRPERLAGISKNEHILIVSGDEDPVGANGAGVRKLEEMYRSLGVADCRLKLYSHARHEILNEDLKDQVIKDIAEFLL